MGKKKVSTEENICFNCVSRVGKKLFNGKKRDVPTVIQGREKKKKRKGCFKGVEEFLFDGKKMRCFIGVSTVRKKDCLTVRKKGCFDGKNGSFNGVSRKGKKVNLTLRKKMF